VFEELKIQAHTHPKLLKLGLRRGRITAAESSRIKLTT
jgi:hypothetical protein